MLGLKGELLTNSDVQKLRTQLADLIKAKTGVHPLQDANSISSSLDILKVTRRKKEKVPVFTSSSRTHKLEPAQLVEEIDFNYAYVATFVNSGWTVKVIVSPWAKHITIECTTGKAVIRPGGENLMNLANAFTGSIAAFKHDYKLLSKLKINKGKEDYSPLGSGEDEAKNPLSFPTVEATLDDTILFEELCLYPVGQASKLDKMRMVVLALASLCDNARLVVTPQKGLPNIGVILQDADKYAFGVSLTRLMSDDMSVPMCHKDDFSGNHITHIVCIERRSINSWHISESKLSIACPRRHAHDSITNRYWVAANFQVVYKGDRVVGPDLDSVCNNCENQLKCSATDFQNTEYYAKLYLPQETTV